MPPRHVRNRRTWRYRLRQRSGLSPQHSSVAAEPRPLLQRGAERRSIDFGGWLRTLQLEPRESLKLGRTVSVTVGATTDCGAQDASCQSPVHQLSR